jgi:mannosyltransferase
MTSPHPTPAEAQPPAAPVKRSIDPYRATGWGILALAVAWHFMNLGARSLWFDESFSWQLIQFPWREMIERAQADVHPPLYYIILKPWTDLFGDSAFAMRLLSVAWFGVVLLGANLLCRESAATLAVSKPSEAGPALGRARDAGLMAMLLLATSPYLFHYSQEARMYTQLIGLCLLSNWLLLRAIRERARPALWWGAYALASAGAAYTHYFGLFAVVAQATFCVGLLMATSGVRGLRPWADPTARRGLIAILLTVGLYLPWVPTLLRQQDQVAKDYWSQSIDVVSPVSFSFWKRIALSCLIYSQADMSVPYRDDSPMVSQVGDALMVGVALLVGLLCWKHGRVGWCLAVGVAMPIDLAIIACLQSGRNIINFRYLMPTYVLLVIGFALVLARIRPRWAHWLIVAAICLILSFLRLQFKESLGLSKNADMRGAADYIAGNHRTGDVVLCLNPLDFFSAKHHARGRYTVHQVRSPKMVIKHYTGGPIFQDSDFLDWQEAIGQRGRRLWIIGRTSDSLPSTLDDWERTERVPFDEAMRYRGRFFADLWQSRPPAQVPPAPHTRPSTKETRGRTDPQGSASAGADRPNQ